MLEINICKNSHYLTQPFWYSLYDTEQQAELYTLRMLWVLLETEQTIKED